MEKIGTNNEFLSGEELMEAIGVFNFDYKELKKVWRDYKKISKNPEDFGYCPCWDLHESWNSNLGGPHSLWPVEKIRHFSREYLLKDQRGKIFEVNATVDKYVKSISLIEPEKEFAKTTLLENSDPSHFWSNGTIIIKDSFLKAHELEILASHIHDPYCVAEQGKKGIKKCMLHPLEVFDIPRLAFPGNGRIFWSDINITKDCGDIYEIGQIRNFPTSRREYGIKIGNFDKPGWKKLMIFLNLGGYAGHKGEIISMEDCNKKISLMHSIRNNN